MNRSITYIYNDFSATCLQIFIHVPGGDSSRRITPAARVPLQRVFCLFLLVWPPLSSLTSFPSLCCPHLRPRVPSKDVGQFTERRVTQPFSFYSLIQVAISRRATGVKRRLELFALSVRMWCCYLFGPFHFNKRPSFKKKHFCGLL